MIGCAVSSEAERRMKHVVHSLEYPFRVESQSKVDTWHVGDNAGVGIAFRGLCRAGVTS